MRGERELTILVGIWVLDQVAASSTSPGMAWLSWVTLLSMLVITPVWLLEWRPRPDPWR